MAKFNPKQIIDIYKEVEASLGAEDAHKQILDVFKEAQKQHGAIYEGEDQGQSWRNVKGTCLEELILYILKASLSDCNVGIIREHRLKKCPHRAEIEEGLLVEFGHNDRWMPDADIIVYELNSRVVRAIISCKASLAERIAQTAYWTEKLRAQHRTKDVRTYLVTLGDGSNESLKNMEERKKRHAIAEYDTDGVYVIDRTSEAWEMTEDGNIKSFGKLIPDIKEMLNKCPTIEIE